MVGIAAAFAGLALLAGILYAVNPDGAMLLFDQLYLTATGYPTEQPAITEGQIAPSDWLHADNASRKVTAVLRRHFPLGSSAAPLRDALRAEGFKFGAPPDQETAKFSWGTVVCEEWVQIDWKADAKDRLTALEAYYRNACL